MGDEARSVGTLHYDGVGSRERSAFAYDETWLGAADRFALEPGLPLVAGPQFHRKVPNGSVFHGAFADTEPDGWAKRVILRDHAKRRQEARRSGKEPKAVQLQSMDFLLAVDDASRVGALRFQDENGVFCRSTEPGHRTAPPLIELSQLLTATRAVETETETAADLAYLRGRGTSLGGMRPKCTVLDEHGRLAIGKFPSVNDERSVTKGEVLAMNLASLSGLPQADDQRGSREDSVHHPGDRHCATHRSRRAFAKTQLAASVSEGSGCDGRISTKVKFTRYLFQRAGNKESSLVFTCSPACCGS